MEMKQHNFIYLYCRNYANSSVDSARRIRDEIRDELCSTIVENVLQIGLFLQIFRPGSRRDKANLCKAKINVSSFVTSE